MSKDHLERRMYRKSPGRQYGYDYDPLKSRDGAGSSSHRSQSGLTASKTGTVLSQRPDPRRTRQLLRKSIIASKRSSDDDDIQYDTYDAGRGAAVYGWQDTPVHEQRPNKRHPVRHDTPVQRSGSARTMRQASDPYEQYEYVDGIPTGSTSQVSRSFSRTGRLGQHLPPSRRPKQETLLLPESGEYAGAWRDMAEVDQDLMGEKVRVSPQEYSDDEDEGYIEDYLDAYVPPREKPVRASRASAIRGTGRLLDPKATRRLPPEEEEESLLSNRIYPEEDEGYDYEYEFEEDRSAVKRAKKRTLTRRGLLFGAGVAAVAGVGIAAIETAPKLPQAASSLGGSLEQQVQDAFNRGVTQGANQVRTEFIDALGNLEGFTLDGAITAARLTRVAYDVFVSPVVKFGSVLTGDFLSGMLDSFKKAREWLAGVYQDNATLIAIQKVLESWVGQVQTMPKKLDSITQADLDGAQSYLRALQRKIEDEKTKLHQSTQATPTPAVTKPASAPTKSSVK